MTRPSGGVYKRNSAVKRKTIQAVFWLLIYGCLGCSRNYTHSGLFKNDECLKECARLINADPLLLASSTNAQRAVALLSRPHSQHSDCANLCAAFCVTEMACAAKDVGLRPVVDLLVKEISTIRVDIKQEMMDDGLVFAHYEALRKYLFEAPETNAAYELIRSNSEVKAWRALFLHNKITIEVAQLFEHDRNHPEKLLEGRDYLRLWVLGSMAGRLVALQQSLDSILDYRHSEEAVTGIASVDAWKRSLFDLAKRSDALSDVERAFVHKARRECIGDGSVVHRLGCISVAE
jgi:hypothetical protein